MLKNQPPLTLALTLILSLSFTSGAFALNYSNRLGNKATFETLEETRVSSPAVAASQGSGKGTFKSHPVLDGYPKGTTYVYRSADLWGGRGNRSNTNIMVFAEKSFHDKDAALGYLKDLGLINIIDTAIGSVVLVTPADPKAGFAAADQKHYYALQTAMLSLGGLKDPTTSLPPTLTATTSAASAFFISSALTAARRSLTTTLPALSTTPAALPAFC